MRFKPEMFLGVEGKRGGFKLNPFSVGRWWRPGEGLAIRVISLT